MGRVGRGATSPVDKAKEKVLHAQLVNKVSHVSLSDGRDGTPGPRVCYPLDGLCSRKVPSHFCRLPP